MDAIGRITHPSGDVILPARTSYDLDVLCEHLVAHASRHGRALLELNGCHSVVTVLRTTRVTCAVCHEPVRHLRFQNGRDMLCRRCVCRADDRLRV